MGASPLALDGRPARCSRSPPTGRGTSGITSSARSRYDGNPVFGFQSTPGGNPLDTFGRNIYVDTFDSAYGTGWKRENSFLTHTGTGAFCYSVNPHGSHPAGKGTSYRATVEGPGVTPDVMWQGVARARTTRPPTRSRTTRSRSSATSSAARTRGRANPSELGSAPWRNAEPSNVRSSGAGRRASPSSSRRSTAAGRADGLVARVALARAALVGISIALQASLHELLREADEWAVSILAGEQEQLAQHFARSVPPIALWDGIDVREDDPRLLTDAAGWLVARTVDQIRTGDHTFFVGEVQSLEEGTAETSLAYVHRGYHAL